ncbi:MAG: SDR family oxidoreductase [candidate division WOR-3 bacterium]|nr:SDR family oxidoreductase [candidate division WOR-3 bacterium]MDW8149870.1 SDR family oxidoreductase [candidate division WOR-3 bacterium]
MRDWALILGSSSGFGAAVSIELSKRGFNIIGVHFDTRATIENAESVRREIENNGKIALFFNLNAGDEEKRKLVLDEFEKKYPNEKIRVLLHSIAFGTLKPFIGENLESSINQKQIEMTLHLMANTLVYWTQDIFFRNLFKIPGSRIFAMTSEGSLRVTKYYGAVSAAKAVLESHVRQLALELVPYGITVNAIRAGVTDTPALRKIPSSDKIIELTLKRNPSGRLTTPEDVAKAIAVLCNEDLYWMTGNIINVDGGETITGIS